MSRNDATDFANRLYARIPAHYRIYDDRQGRPLLALLAVVGAQVAAVRADMDALWDDFFIETCADWAVPYIGALVGTSVLPGATVGQTSRLDVWNTVAWRRRKGTPAMLASLANAIAEWPASLDEFAAGLGWSQNVDHVRLERPLTVDVRDPAALDDLGGPSDPFAHAVDLQAGAALDTARVTATSGGVPVARYGTRGRYDIGRVGIFFNRLQTAPVAGGTPAGAAPGVDVPAGQRCFTFDPLFRGAPLFTSESGAPISRAAFDAAPWGFGGDVMVRAFGVPLTSDTAPQPQGSSSGTAFTFGNAGAPFALDAAAGLSLIEANGILPAPAFVLRALWYDAAGATVLASLGTLQTSSAARDGGAFTLGVPAPAAGRLAVSLACAEGSVAGRFPGGVLALRAAPAGAVRAADGVYASLPAAYVTAGAPQLFWIDDAGAAYGSPALDAESRLTEGIGPAYPPSPAGASPEAARFAALHRLLGLHVVDTGRFGIGAATIVAAPNGNFSAPLGTIASEATASVAAWAYQASPGALAGSVPGAPSDVLTLQLSGAGALPPTEVIATDRRGDTLLIYLPEVSAADAAAGVQFAIGSDGSSYDLPPEGDPARDVAVAGDLSALTVARASAGQVLPIVGLWPLRRRRAIGIDHSRVEPALGEVGIDPEAGWIRLAYGDPVVGSDALRVDYVQARTGPVGAPADPAVWLAAQAVAPTQAPPAATRFVAASGDVASPLADVLAGAPVHLTLADALANARDGDVVEIVDSATYVTAGPATVALADGTPAAPVSLVLRAAQGQRPVSVAAAGGPPGGIVVATSWCSFALIGVLVWGGPLSVTGQGADVALAACSLAPPGATPSIEALSAELDGRGRMSVSNCTLGPLSLAAGVESLTISDSIVDGGGASAIAGAGGTPLAAQLQLVRTTVLGTVSATVLYASDTLFDGMVTAADRTSGCVRFSRVTGDSLLPPRFRCTSASVAFGSRRFGRVDYARLVAGTAAAVLTAGEDGAEPGAFAARLDTLRLANVQTKLREFMPIGLIPVLIGTT